jgi:hypothetical protein
MAATARNWERSGAIVGEPACSADSDHEPVLGLHEERRQFEEHLTHTVIVDFPKPPAAFLVCARFMVPSFSLFVPVQSGVNYLYIYID